MPDYSPICATDRVLITGAAGMLGRAVVPALRRQCATVLTPARTELDLLDRRATLAYFDRERPTVVVMLAARVGGIQANIAAPYEFLTDNLYIHAHTFDGVIAALVIEHSIARCAKGARASSRIKRRVCSPRTFSSSSAISVVPP